MVTGPARDRIGAHRSERAQPHVLEEPPGAQERGSVTEEERFLVYNMGVVWVSVSRVIVNPAGVEAALSVIMRHGKRASVTGRVIEDSERAMHIDPEKAQGHGRSALSRV